MQENTPSSLVNSVNALENPEEPAINTEGTPAEPIVLEQGKKLSDCILFDLIKTYYTEQGVNAWLAGTPNFVTSNTIIAEGYADLMITFLLENLSKLNLDEPVYIVELAAGVGHFSFLVLKELERKICYFSALHTVKLVYVMTDFTTGHTNYWKTHEAFQPWFNQGVLDVATFNPLIDQTIHLEAANMTLTPALLENPMIVIANYFFDTITHDAFKVKSKTLSEGLVTVTRTLKDTTNAEAPVDLSELGMHYQYKEVLNPKAYYACPRVNQVLNSYRHDIKDGTLTFPIGAFQVLENLMSLCNRNMFLISSDKAYTNVNYMSMMESHTFTYHSSISFMVNFDAIGRYFKQMGGRYWATGEHDVSLQTMCCTFTPKLNSAYEKLNYTFEEKFNRGTKITRLPLMLYRSTLKYKTIKNSITQTLDQIQLGLKDSRLFASLVSGLLDVIPQIGLAQRITLFRLVDEGLALYYRYPGSDDLPFQLSVLCHKLGDYQRSINCLDKALSYQEGNRFLLFMKAQNMERLNNKKEALALYQEITTLDPDFAEAQECVMRLLPA
jgi:tetratricopeptide (TPR) repeat protein